MLIQRNLGNMGNATYWEGLKLKKLMRYRGYGIVANGIYCQEHKDLMHRLINTEAGRELNEIMAEELLSLHNSGSLNLRKVDYDVYRKRFGDSGEVGYHFLTRNARLPDYKTLVTYSQGETKRPLRLVQYLIMADFCDVDLLEYFGIEIRSAGLIPDPRWRERDLSVEAMKYVLSRTPFAEDRRSLVALAEKLGVAYDTLRRRIKPTTYALDMDGRILPVGHKLSIEEKEEIADAIGVPLWLIVEGDNERITYKGADDGTDD